MSKIDVAILKRGLKRTALAMLTALSFALAVAGFIAVAFVHGYWAVLLFATSIFAWFFSVSLLYAQGLKPVSRKERTGESK